MIIMARNHYLFSIGFSCLGFTENFMGFHEKQKNIFNEGGNKNWLKVFSKF